MPNAHTSPAADDVNALLDAARVPIAVSASAASLAGAGLVVALLGFQNLTLVSWVGSYALFPWSLIAVGAGAIFVAAKLMHARRWTLWPAFALAIVLTLGAVGFFAMSSLAGVFTPLSVIGIGGGITAIVFAALAIRPFRRIAHTRKRLRDLGFDLDL